MSDERQEKLTREAADIFLRLRDDPENSELQSARDTFRARGQIEREIYDELAKTWKASGIMQAPKTLRSIILIASALIGAATLAYTPLKVTLLADLQTGSNPLQTSLVSGDGVHLDADTALIDNTDSRVRAVAILEGAAFFEVENEARPFAVKLGDIRVTVVGTAFEAALIDNAVLVSVAEGEVEVRLDDQVWALTANTQFTWSEARGGSVTSRQGVNIATWRANRLVVDGLTMGQAVAIIERRLAGSVVFTNAFLRNTRVSGNLDLSDPLAALRILAETGGGRVFHVPGLGRVIASR